MSLFSLLGSTLQCPTRNANTEQERGQDEQQQPLLLLQAREEKRMQMVKETRQSTTMDKQSGWNKLEEKNKVIIRLGGNHALVERALKREKEEKRVEWFVSRRSGAEVICVRTARDKSNGPSFARRLSQRGDASMRWRDCVKKM